MKKRDESKEKGLEMSIESDDIAKDFSKPHPKFAGVIDWYFILIIIMAISAVIAAITNKPSLLLTSTEGVIILYVVTIFGTIFYHAKIAKEVSFLSIGERLAGKEIIDNKKQWFNRYQTNRLGIFLIIMINLSMMGNTWDQLSYGNIYSLFEIFTRSVRIGIITFTLVEIIKGKLNGILFLIAMSSFSGVYSYFFQENIQLKQIALKMYFGLAIVFFIIYMIYRIKRKEAVEI